MLVKKPIRRRPKNNLDRHQQKKFLTDVDQKIALIDVGQKTLDDIDKKNSLNQRRPKKLLLTLIGKNNLYR